MNENYFLEMGSNCPISTNGAVQFTQERVRKAQDRQDEGFHVPRHRLPDPAQPDDAHSFPAEYTMMCNNIDP
jgi:hypothetical protein